MSDQYPPPGGSYPPPGGSYPPPGGDQPPQYGAPQYGPPSGPPAGPPFGAPPPPPKKSSAGKIILIILGVLLVLLLVCCGGIYFFAKDTWNDIVDEVNSSSTNAKVGDCLAGDSIEGTGNQNVSLKIVKCDDSTAKYKVVGIHEGIPQAEALKDGTTVCDDFVDKGAERVLWQGTNSASGQVLCLGPAK